jgi:phosphoserine aminotransferase
MRITIDIPEDRHRQAVSIARDTSRSLSETVADLMRRGLSQGSASTIGRSAVTGMPVVHLGNAIPTDDVRSLDDDQ